jgi:hypothetical protein
MSLQYCPPAPTAARPCAKRWRTLLCTGLVAGFLAACGGGGGDAAAGGPGTGTLAGAWYYDSAGKAARFDLATATEASFPLDVSSTRLLGYGGSGFTDVQEYVSTSAAPTEYVVNVRRSTAPYFDKIGELPRFSITGGFVSGPVQPSPNGVLYAVPTNESMGLGAPYVDYINLVDTKLNAVLRVTDLRHPAWVDNGRIVAVGSDGLFSVASTAGAAPARIGPAGLGVPGAAPSRPSVSPDGRDIAFVQGDAIWRIGVDGSGLTQLTQTRPAQAWPAWSPDGKQLAVIFGVCPPVGTGVSNPDIVVISASVAKQDIDEVFRQTRTRVRTCGPVTWLAQ